MKTKIENHKIYHLLDIFKAKAKHLGWLENEYEATHAEKINKLEDELHEIKEEILKI